MPMGIGRKQNGLKNEMQEREREAGRNGLGPGLGSTDASHVVSWTRLDTPRRPCENEGQVKAAAFGLEVDAFTASD